MLQKGRSLQFKFEWKKWQLQVIRNGSDMLNIFQSFLRITTGQLAFHRLWGAHIRIKTSILNFLRTCLKGPNDLYTISSQLRQVILDPMLKINKEPTVNYICTMKDIP